MAAVFALGLAACGAGTPGGATGALWYAGRAVCAFTNGQLATSRTEMPGIVATSPPLTAFSDVALDRDGNVWAVGVGADEVLRFPAAALTGSGVVGADLVIRSPALRSPGNLVFDASGNLWVANRRGGTDSVPTSDGSIVRFDRPQPLRGNQDLTPSVRIRSTQQGALYLLGAIAFDTTGNLWATSYSGILRYDHPGNLTGEVVPDPGLVIQNAGYLPESVYFYTIAFDASGALWAAAQTSGFSLTSVMKFANAGKLSGSTSPSPEVTITGELDLLPAGGLAFDGDGSLWLATADAILKYSNPGELSGTVNPMPTVKLGVFNEASPALHARLTFSAPPVITYVR
jgi:ligand-binding sensor domain-containing protein